MLELVNYSIPFKVLFSFLEIFVNHYNLSCIDLSLLEILAKNSNPTIKLILVKYSIPCLSIGINNISIEKYYKSFHFLKYS